MKVLDYISTGADFLTIKETEELKNILNYIIINGKSERAEKEIKKVLEK